MPHNKKNSPVLSKCVSASLFVFVTIIGLNHASAQSSCTEIGCIDGLNLTVDPSFDWDGGTYESEVLAGTNRYICNGKLPLDPCDQNNENTFGCNSPNITIGESGCMLPASQHGISGIYIKGEPKTVQIRITRNGKPYITRALAPEYRTSQPNGPGCLPVCRSASHNLLIAE